MIVWRRVRDHIPLEQGLRPRPAPRTGTPRLVRDHIPLEQGLRQLQLVAISGLNLVRDHIPLEQGLRRPIHPRSREATS